MEGEGREGRERRGVVKDSLTTTGEYILLLCHRVGLGGEGRREERGGVVSPPAVLSLLSSGMSGRESLVD